MFTSIVRGDLSLGCRNIYLLKQIQAQEFELESLFSLFDDWMFTQ